MEDIRIYKVLKSMILDDIIGSDDIICFYDAKGKDPTPRLMAL